VVPCQDSRGLPLPSFLPVLRWLVRHPRDSPSTLFSGKIFSSTSTFGLSLPKEDVLSTEVNSPFHFSDA